jgi:predicted DNA-binding transcriptional regulator AlpA
LLYRGQRCRQFSTAFGGWGRNKVLADYFPWSALAGGSRWQAHPVPRVVIMSKTEHAASPLKSTEWLAQRLGLSVTTVERLRASKPDDLPQHISIGHSIRYSEEHVESWIAASVATGKAGGAIAQEPSHD